MSLNSPVRRPASRRFPARPETPPPAPEDDRRPWRESLVRLLDNLPEGACLVERGQGITYWSANAEQLSGYSGTATLGRPCAHQLLAFTDETGAPLCSAACPVAASLEDGEARELQVRLRRRDGEALVARLRIVPYCDAAGQLAGVIELFADSSTHETSRVRIAELQKALLVDPLTDLANRRYATLRLETRLKELARFGWSFGAVFFDIDQFKAVNDRYGHATGDRALAQVARTAARCVRSADTLCRWGGDEFLALIAHVNSEQLGQLAEKMRALVAQSPLRAPQGDLSVTLSIGAALAVVGEGPDELLARVDHLMYVSKAQGGNRVTLSAPGTALPAGDPTADAAGPLRILLADDHAVVRQGLVALLRAEPDLQIVGEAANGREAVELADELAPDVVLMDANMPIMDGIEATRLIHERHPTLRVIGLSMLADPETGVRMTAAGAQLCVSKAASAHELLRVLRGAARR